MDGLLVDSMLHWLELDKEWFRGRDTELTPDLIKHLTGRSVQENIVYIKEQYGFEESVEELIREREGWFQKIYQEKTRVMPGVEELFVSIKKKLIFQALASGAPMKVIDTVLDRFCWRGYFDELVSADHVNCVGKPDPGIFLYTAEKLRVKPAECVVFEDAENGVVAAKRAGMACVAVPDSRWSFGNFDEADLLVDSLENKQVYTFLGI